MKTTYKRNLVIILAVFAALTGLGIFVSQRRQTSSTPEQVSVASTVSQTQTSSNASPQPDLSSQLSYLIEEEKLAHDVYTVMAEKYGASVFSNILKSEQTHQARVLVVMQANQIPDPRKAEIGVFTNQELQKLYDDLITQGNISVQEAYKVGVIIEERDITDISKQLATATDEAVISTLEALRNGSENHLRAFNRQLGN